MDDLFLDYASTTPIGKGVLNGILRDSIFYGNPSSKHAFGEKVKDRIEKTREELSKYLNCDSNEIFFTSGGTEGNNLIIKGLARRNKNKRHILISEIEHPSVMMSANSLVNEGFVVEKVGVDSEGIVILEDLKNKIREDTLLVSIMHVNNEIGTIQPIEEISKICKERGVYFHSDMVQSLKKLKINLTKLGLDLATFSGHKINAPKGIGFIYIKHGVGLESLFSGGGQESGVRNGTENVLGILSLSKAIHISEDQNRVRKARDYLVREVLKIPGARLNGSLKKRIFGNLNFSFYGIEGESIMLLLSRKKIYVSTGSACNSSKLDHSHVLTAIGVDELYINGSIRISFDKLTIREAKFFVDNLRGIVFKLQKISPFKLNKEEK